MMKYRIYDTHLKEYVNDCYIDKNGRIHKNIYYDFYEDGYRNNLIVEQFIGLQDCKGVEIYCGDNVKHGDSIVTVIWDEQYCMFVFKDGSVLNKHHQKHYEVIGNVHKEVKK